MTCAVPVVEELHHNYAVSEGPSVKPCLDQVSREKHANDSCHLLLLRPQEKKKRSRQAETTYTKIIRNGSCASLKVHCI